MPFDTRIKNSYSFKNIIVTLIMIVVTIGFIMGLNNMFSPLVTASQNIDLSFLKLPEYSYRTAMRLILAMLLSVIIAVIYAVLTVKNKRIGAFLFPLLDVFQSVPVLGYLSFTVTAFVAIDPNNIIGIEIAIIFALFTAQVWNLILSVYQSLTSVPKDLYDVAAIYKLNKWQIFWQIELPYAIPGIVWNMILSMSSSWFFIVASEAIAVGSQTYALPGIGTYIAVALKQMDIAAVSAAIIAILLVINIFNQLFFQPLISWSYKFRYEFTTGVTTINKSSWLYNYSLNSSSFNYLLNMFNMLGSIILQIKLPKIINQNINKIAHFFEIIWWGAVCYCLFMLAKQLHFIWQHNMNMQEVLHVIKLGFYTMLRVFAMIMISSIIWLPIGVFISARPVLSRRIQPLIQFLTALPANIYFPAFVMVIMYFKLNPEIWLSAMMVIGSQWYILYNVIAGGQSIPTEILEASRNFKLAGFNKWRKMILPAIFPFYLTGLVAAAGGAWNASIVAEVINWGNNTLQATGLGAYITVNTNTGDYSKIAIGVIVMSCYVVLINNLLWQPLYRYAAKNFRLD